VIVCDCVGILKERHSDIEGKMSKQKLRTNWKKKSTKCRMVFRAEVELVSGKTEILQESVLCVSVSAELISDIFYPQISDKFPL
jgi:hypothetical protein